MSETMLRRSADFEVPLLKLLNGYPDGAGLRQDVIQSSLVDFRESMPPDFSTKVQGRYRTLGNKLDTAKKNLTELGFLETPNVGFWRITDRGKQWLAENSDATHILTLARRTPRPPSTGRRADRAKRSSPTPPGISFEMLEQTRRAMQAEQFNLIWGAIYDQLLAEERAKAITQLSDRQLLQAVRQPVSRIQDFLQGRGNDTPKSEDVCDWIQFCYTLGLYREGAALWQYVQRDEVNAWLYERSKKIAAVCRTRIGT